MGWRSAVKHLEKGFKSCSLRQSIVRHSFQALARGHCIRLLHVFVGDTFFAESIFLENFSTKIPT